MARSSVGKNSTAGGDGTILLKDDAVTTQTVLDYARNSSRKSAWVVEVDIGVKLPGRVGWNANVLVELTTCVVVGGQCILDKCFVVRVASERSYRELGTVCTSSVPSVGGTPVEVAVCDDVASSGSGVRVGRRRRGLA